MFDVCSHEIHPFVLCKFTVSHNGTHLLALIAPATPLLVLQRYKTLHPTREVSASDSLTLFVPFA